MTGRVYTNQFRSDRGRAPDLDALFDEIFPPPSQVEESTSFVGPVWAPRVDVSASDTDYQVTMDVPGIRHDDITVKIQGRRLTICGSRSEAAEGRTYLRVERRRGDFCRVLTLPPDAQLDAIDMTCHDGVVTLTIPKA